MPERSIQFTEGMRTTTVGVIGTVTALTLERYSLMASAVAASATALYMTFKCIDWIIEKRYGKRSKTKKKL